MVSALLVLVFLGFGALLGNVASAPAPSALASARSPLRVVLPAARGEAPRTATTPSPRESNTAGSEPPSSPVASEPTPAPASTGAGAGAGAGKTSSGTSDTSGAGSSSGGGSSSSQGSSKPAASGPAKKLPPIKHVFVIMLSDEPYASVFGPSSTAPYLAHTLEHEGELLVHYDAVAHEELANEAALVSGQGPTAETAANCPTYTEIAATGSGPDEQVLGSGCVYPRSTQTLASELAPST